MIFIHSVIGASMAVVYAFKQDYRNLFNHAVFVLYVPLEVLFIILAFSTYGFLFHKYWKLRAPPVQVSGITAPSPSVLQVFRKSRFYVAILLITTFFIFAIIPEMMLHLSMASFSDETKEVILMFIVVGWVCDAVIYVFMNPSVKRLLMRKVGGTVRSR